LSLLGDREAQPSIIGIIVLIVAAIAMPWLASQKRKVAIQVASAALRADATESAVRGYLSLIALAGLLANAIFHVPWADPLAALVLQHASDKRRAIREILQMDDPKAFLAKSGWFPAIQFQQSAGCLP
jgi:hypothetical protein